MNICVFLGPSLKLSRAKQLIDASFYPPVKMGDVYRVCQTEPDAIVIIDGIFEQTPAVWHKEILYAIDKGIPVFGASSMGALRAAELSAFGMIGLGEIYRDFETGLMEDDDEVAVVHASEGEHTVQSEAMVNIRYAFQQMVSEDVVKKSVADHLVNFAKSQFYPERSWASVFLEAERIDTQTASTIRDFISTVNPNKKREDAITCLTTINELVSERKIPKVDKNFEFESTVYWETVEKYFGFEQSSTDDSVMTEKVRNHTRIFPRERKSIVQQSLFYHFIESEAKRLGFSEVDDKLALQAFRYQHNLLSPRVLSAWLNEHHISNDECLKIARLDYLCSKLETHYVSAVDSKLSLSAKAKGHYKSIYESVKAKQSMLEEWGISNLSEVDVGSQQKVLDWYQNQFGSQGLALTEHMHALGFGETRIFLNELYAQYLFSQQSPVDVLAQGRLS